MRIITVFFVLALLGQAHVKKVQNFKDEFVDSLVHSLSSKLFDMLLDRKLRRPLLHSSDLHNSTLGMPRILATSSQTNPVVHQFKEAVDVGRPSRRNFGRAALKRPSYFGEPAHATFAFPARTNSRRSLKVSAEFDAYGMPVERSAEEKATKEVPLNSDCGMDYLPLKQFLEKGEFQNADDETRDLLIRLAGPGAEKRGYVYFSEVKPIPVADMQTIDSLWKAYSGGKFGYSVQKMIWTKKLERWEDFFKQINWFKKTEGSDYNMYRKWPTDFIYDKTAVQGHLPLTNANRGTTLLESILKHPAFNKTRR